MADWVQSLEGEDTRRHLIRFRAADIGRRRREPEAVGVAMQGLVEGGGHRQRAGLRRARVFGPHHTVIDPEGCGEDGEDLRRHAARA